MPHVENVASGGSGKRKKRHGDSLSVYKAIIRLCQSQEALVKQIGRLAQSNEDLVQAMAEDNAQEDEQEARHL